MKLAHFEDTSLSIIWDQEEDSFYKPKIQALI